MTPALPLPDKPSVSVLPFTNMSADPEQEFLADGIADDIITALSRYAGDTPLEEAGFELLVPRKTPGPLAGVGSCSRRLFLVGGKSAEATRGDLETLVVPCGTKRWYGAGDEEMAPSSLANN